jgi:hypothetical protein
VVGVGSELTGRGWAWRVKLEAEPQLGVMTETEVARIERDEQAAVADLGLRPTETKQHTAALRAQIVPAQVVVRRRSYASCGRKLASKGHYPVTFRSLFGDVPVRVRRLLACPCQGQCDALEQDDSAVVPRRTHRRVERQPQGSLPPSLSGFRPTNDDQVQSEAA